MAVSALPWVAPESTVEAAKSVVSASPPKVTVILFAAVSLMPTWNVMAAPVVDKKATPLKRALP
ncbi:MAG: hypothetical protein U0263_10045 [Polyangiaceae bacterium]